MFRSKISILWLPLIWVGVFVFVFCLGLILKNGLIIWFTVMISWIGSFVCGRYAMEKNKEKYPSAYWLYFNVYVLALIVSLGCCVIPILFLGLAYLLWFVSISFVLYVIIRDAIRKVYDVRTWILYGTQILSALPLLCILIGGLISK